MIRTGWQAAWHVWTVVACITTVGAACAQDRLPSAPGYEHYRQYEQQLRQARGAILAGEPTPPSWAEDGKSFTYRQSGQIFRFDIATGKAGPTDAGAVTGGPERRFRGGGPGRGRQYTSAESPDHKYRAVYKDANLWLNATGSSDPIQITTDGSARERIKYGSASWVYGEELEQQTAIWWSPDSKQVAFYRFDESKVPNYYVLMSQRGIQDTEDVEAYPKAGSANPIADIYIYNLDTKKTIRVDTRDGKPADNDVVGYYVYNVQWTPDGKELLYNRTDRKQKVLEIAAADPATGKSRVVVHEASPESYTENLPPMIFLHDGHRFLLISGRNGWRNLYLYDLSGKLLAPITQHSFDVANVERIVESTGTIFYTAHDGDNPMKLQLHRVGLDGKGEKLLTDPTRMHTVTVAPDGLHFVDTSESHDVPPQIDLRDGDGKLLSNLFKADLTAWNALHIPAPELLSLKAADGKTDIYGMLYKPSNFDPNKKYPLLISVYAGPTVTEVHERFGQMNALTELGFLVASFDGRGTPGRGRAFETATYGKLGGVDIDDQAAGVKYLCQRPYVDSTRVGIFGTSYGGYASAMCLLRYPDVYKAACAMSSVTDWKNYDTIYTERYMGLPEENKTGYDAGSAMTYAPNLHGKLMLYFGSADNNVHPANTLQLVAALQRARKGFELQIGPDLGHTALDQARMLEFFLDAFGMWGHS